MADRQLRDLAALGLTWDGDVLAQSTRRDAYDDAIARLVSAGLTYECFCTRREIREAASAPQGANDGGYLGTCRELSAVDRARMVEVGRRPALRLCAQTRRIAISDALHPGFVGGVHDIVLRRSDGVAAYNVAVVVDDAAQRVDQVVRGDDLLASTPSQVHVGDLLGLPRLTYVHVPLILNRQGDRLAKRDGAVTLEDLAAIGTSPSDVLSRLATSLGLAAEAEIVTPTELLGRFDLNAIPREPWILG